MMSLMDVANLHVIWRQEELRSTLSSRLYHRGDRFRTKTPIKIGRRELCACLGLRRRALGVELDWDVIPRTTQYVRL